MRSNLDELQGRHDELAADVSRLDAERERFRKEQEGIGTAVATLEEKRREAERIHDEAREQLRVSVTKVETERAVLKKLEQDVERLGQEKQEREVALAAVATKIESLKVEERRLLMLLAETDEASRRHQEAQANLEASVAALAAARSDRDRLAAEVAAGRVRAEELRRMSAEREQARQEAESDFVQLNQDVEETKRALRELEGQRKAIGERDRRSHQKAPGDVAGQRRRTRTDGRIT